MTTVKLQQTKTHSCPVTAIVFHGVLAGIALCASTLTGAEQPATNQTFQLAVTLTDGSLLKGKPLLSTVSIQTAYAKIEVPLSQIRTLAMESNHENALLELTNGDKLTGALNLPPIGLNTIFGKVAVGVQCVSTVSVYSDGEGAIPQEGLVLYYSFDRAEKDQVTDSSGKGHHGKANGATWTPQGRFGGACNFDGSDDSITVPGYKGILGNNPWTVSFWFKRGNDNGAQQDFIGWGGWGSGIRGDIVEILLSDGELYEHYGALDHHTGTFVKDSNWHHYVMVKGATTQQRYLDGVSLNDETSFTLAVGSRSDVSIGKRQVGNELCFGGLLDDICIYDRALSAEEITALYKRHK